MRHGAVVLVAAVLLAASGCASRQLGSSPPGQRRAEDVLARAALEDGYARVKEACPLLRAHPDEPAEVAEVARWSESCVDGSVGKSTEADALVQARRLLVEACDAFRRAERLARPTLPTLFFLGRCEEQAAHAAAAREYYGRARTLNNLEPGSEQAKKDSEALLKVALDRVHAKVAWLVIDTKHAPSGLELFLDAVPVPREQWDRELPIDAGQRVLYARAAGYVDRDWSFAAVAQQPATQLSLELHPKTTRKVGVGVAAAGVVALGVAAYLGVHTLALVSRSNDHCTDDDVCSNEGADLRDRAVHSQSIGLAFASGGALAVGAGALLYTW